MLDVEGGIGQGIKKRRDRTTGWSGRAWTGRTIQVGRVVFLEQFSEGSGHLLLSFWGDERKPATGYGQYLVSLDKLREYPEVAPHLSLP